MRWPWSSGSSSDLNRKDDDSTTFLPPKLSPQSWSSESLNATDWIAPNNIIGSVILTSATLLLIRFYKSHLRRIPTTNHIKPDYFRKRSMFGTVTSVGDADNFRLFHTPGGRLTGWGWLPGRQVPTEKGQLVGKTIPVRIAGVDAPELAHWGQEAQPYGEEAQQWLKEYVLSRRVRVYIHRRDQYDRVVATVFIRRGLNPFRKDVGLEMLKKGLATVYEAKSGAEFGGFEDQYKQAQEDAKQRKVGMWSKPGILARFMGKASQLETPREYKTRTAAGKKAAGAKS